MTELLEPIISSGVLLCIIIIIFVPKPWNSVNFTAWKKAVRIFFATLVAEED